MPVDLTAIRALLASVAGFTEGPWGFEDDGLVWADGTPMDPICHTAPRIDGLPDAPLIAAAPDLHRELTEAVAEIERLRAHNARMVAMLNIMANAMQSRSEMLDGDAVDADDLISFIKRDGKDVPALRDLAAGEVDDG